MTKPQKNLLWRAEWCHRMGYQAPTQEVWAKTKKEAIDMAKKKSRLGDFPKSWSVKLTDITAEYEYELRQKGKFLTDDMRR